MTWWVEALIALGVIVMWAVLSVFYLAWLEGDWPPKRDRR